MAVPEFQNFLLPLLKATGDGTEHRIRDLVPVLSSELGLGEEDRAKLLASGSQTVLENRVYWAATYLRKAGLLTATGRGVVRISDEGRPVLANPPGRIDKGFLSQYPSFREFAMGASPLNRRAAGPKLLSRWSRSHRRNGSNRDGKRFGLLCHRTFLSSSSLSTTTVLRAARGRSPTRHGLYGSRRDASKLVGRPGDGGIDGTIAEDKLGLDVVYVQAKRWDGVVGR